MATFVAAYTQHRGDKISGEPTTMAHRESIANRWVAARDGMQATFIWRGLARPVAEVLSEMLDECSENLAQLGARRSDFVLIEMMIRKRKCQADYLLTLAERYPDPYQLGSVVVKMLRHREAYDEFLEQGLVLDPRPPLDQDQIRELHLNEIGEATLFQHSRDIMRLPAPTVDAILKELIDSGEVCCEVIPERGKLLSRTSAPTRNGRAF
jgi:hypothetical protein